MKTFQSMRKYYRVAGIDWHQSIQKGPLNARNSMVLFILGLSITLNWIYTLYVASDFLEYIQSIQNGFLYILVILMFLVAVLKMRQLFQFVNSFGFIVQKRK